jgi:hypothetical protein
MGSLSKDLLNLFLSGKLSDFEYGPIKAHEAIIYARCPTILEDESWKKWSPTSMQLFFQYLYSDNISIKGEGVITEEPLAQVPIHSFPLTN